MESVRPVRDPADRLSPHAASRRERKARTMATTDKAALEAQAVLDKIDSFPEPYREIGRRLHETILHAGPKLKPRLWYGMPGYATGRSTPVLVFFRVDDGVMSFSISEKAHIERDPAATDALLPCAWVPARVRRRDRREGRRDRAHGVRRVIDPHH